MSVADKIAWLTEILQERGSVDLLELIAGLANRTERIASFLAVLEMVRLQVIVLFQRATQGTIRVALRNDAPAAPVLATDAGADGLALEEQ